MDDLDQREAFLLPIFAAPDDDLPRLVFADWLDERGESAWAELIRAQCEFERLRPEGGIPPTNANIIDRIGWLEKRINKLKRGSPKIDALHELDAPMCWGRLSRGFLERCGTAIPLRIFLATDQLGEPQEFRKSALAHYPHWYSATALKVSRGLIASSKPINTILTSPVTQRVTELDLSGAVVETPSDDDFELPLRDFVYHPAVTLLAVEALVNARECRRVTHLDLRNNDLDNDAARAIVRSTNLIRLESLRLSEGNQLRGRTWAQLVERFGEDVVQ